MTQPPAPPGFPPEDGAGGEPADPPRRRPDWPAWYAPAGFVLAAGLTLLGGVAVAGATTAVGVRDRTVLGVLQTLVQDAALVACAVGLAAQTARPRLWHFGLGRAPLGPLLRAGVLGYLAYLAAGQLYALAFDPEGEQRIVQQLGADDSMASFVAIGLLVIVVAPVVEELFFRGFFFRALRNRLSFPVAALVDGLVFGVVHFTGSETLSILPVFVMLGFVFCWVVERTGSLYPTIAMHAFNNALAYAALTRLSDAVPAVIGVAAVAGALAAARLVPGPARLAPS
jgi:membrane protease YdiL (CAAX protease family)